VSVKTIRIVIVCLAIMLVISILFPYERFNVDIKYSTIIRIIVGAVAIGVGVRLAFALR